MERYWMYEKGANIKNINKYKKIALKKNPNLFINEWYLDEDFAGLKKGYVYKIVDSKTYRQSHLNWQSREEAWKYVAIIDPDYPSYLAKP